MQVAGQPPERGAFGEQRLDKGVLHFLRAERKFNSIEALRGQITADVEVAQRLLRDG